MRNFISLIFIVSCFYVNGQGRDKNSKPEIFGQKNLSVSQGQSITIQLSDLFVIDWDNKYPDDFTLQIYEDGDNYKTSGNTVFPDDDFTGTLRVPVRVNDGKDESKKYDLRITVNKVINQRPIIIGHDPLSTNANQSITLRLTDISVVDLDSSYPSDFTLNVKSGSNYSVSGSTVTPSQNYVGTLTVPVTVHDGHSESPPFNVKIQVLVVNKPPIITGQVALSTNENQPVTIQLSHLLVSDADNKYPDDFTLKVLSGNGYKVSGNTVTPSTDFTGTLSVNVTVHDGTDNSAAFGLKIQVNAVNDIPQITAQVPLRINEDESIALQLTHLKVTDNDDNYPTGFTINVLSGDNYAVSENITVQPASNFNGSLTVPVTVNDGTNDSSPFNLVITVNPINDAPQILKIENEPLVYETDGNALLLTRTSEVIDVDDDTLAIAEIKFNSETYKAGKDGLLFTNTQSIRGVFDANEGILSLIGRASVLEYQQALRSIQYNYVVLDGDTMVKDKTVFITLTDGKSGSIPASRQIALRDSYVDLDIPSGFTPNGDMVNDTWSVRPLKTTEAFVKPVIRVYNKRGMMVYEGTGFDSEWNGIFNGEFLPSDTYFYTIDLNLPFTKTKYNGLVTILR
jgi:gliding motility-associated-like protein